MEYFITVYWYLYIFFILPFVSQDEIFKAKDLAATASLSADKGVLAGHDAEDAEYAAYAEAVRAEWERKGRSTLPLERCMPKPPRAQKSGPDTFARLGMAPLRAQQRAQAAALAAAQALRKDESQTETSIGTDGATSTANVVVLDRILNNPVGWAESAPIPPEHFNPVIEDLYPKVHTRSSLPEVPRPRMWSELDKLGS
jgi:hypothetical protein